MSYSRPPLDPGTRFGRLTVLGVDDEKSVPKRRWYRLQCDCGKQTSSRVDALSAGDTVSCGCKKREHNYRHGLRSNGTSDRTYNSWDNMLQRCTNPNREEWPYYGGRGLKVCKRWHKFENFLADMGERPEGLTLERVKNHLGYRPSNCVWATREEQARNKRPKGTCLKALK